MSNIFFQIYAFQDTGCMKMLQIGQRVFTQSPYSAAKHLFWFLQNYFNDFRWEDGIMKLLKR